MSSSHRSQSRLIITAALVALVLSSLLPGPLRVGLEVLLLAWALRPLVQRRVPRRLFYASGLLLIVAVYWGLLLLHPNVPGMDIGLLGWRKSVIALCGIPIGLQLRRTGGARVERTIVGTLTVALAASVVVYFLLPGLEEQISRDAAHATSTLEGARRLQGLFAGPFHAAIAAGFLLSWSVLRAGKWRALALCAGATGATGLILSNVRTGYVAVVLVAFVLVTARSTGDLSKRSIAHRRRVVVIGVLAFALFVAWGGSTTALESLSGISSDDRFTNRFEAWGSAVDAVESSPTYGHGAGSAGDTLGAEFTGERRHWTSHNVLLKWAVEGGVVGLGLVLWLLIVGLGPTVRGAGKLASPGGVVVILFIVFGATGAIIEAMPVSFFLLTLAAATAQDPPVPLRTDQLSEASAQTASRSRDRRV